jgi:hypothetical protein
METLASREMADEQERLSGGNVRGSIVRAHLQWVTAYGNSRDWQQLWWGLEDEIDRAFSGSIDDAGWYPFRWLILLDRAIFRQFGNGVDEHALFEDLGRFSARVHLGAPSIGWAPPAHHEFFERSILLHREYQDFGQVVYRRTGETAGEMVHSQSPCFSRVYCASAVGYYEQCLMRHGAIKVTVTEETCKCLGWDSCRFALKWR